MLNRMLRLNLRTALIGLAVLAMIFAYTGEAARSYDREQSALSQIPDLKLTTGSPVGGLWLIDFG